LSTSAKIKRLFHIFNCSFSRFIIVGLINTAVGTAVMFVAYNLIGCGYWISSALNYIIGSIVSYFLNKYFTFRDYERGFKKVIRFVLNISVCYFLAYGIAQKVIYWILSEYNLQVRDNISMIAGMGLFVMLNYLGQRLFVFSAPHQSSRREI